MEYQQHIVPRLCSVLYNEKTLPSAWPIPRTEINSIAVHLLRQTVPTTDMCSLPGVSLHPAAICCLFLPLPLSLFPSTTHCVSLHLVNFMMLLISFLHVRIRLQSHLYITLLGQKTLVAQAAIVVATVTEYGLVNCSYRHQCVTSFDPRQLLWLLTQSPVMC